MNAQQGGHGGQSNTQESPEVPWVTLEEIGVQIVQLSQMVTAGACVESPAAAQQVAV